MCSGPRGRAVCQEEVETELTWLCSDLKTPPHTVLYLSVLRGGTGAPGLTCPPPGWGPSFLGISPG